MVVNALLAAILINPVWIGVTATVAAVIMWLSFERLSYLFELCAEKVVNEKLRAAPKAKS
jgi:hypothetical protein